MLWRQIQSFLVVRSLLDHSGSCSPTVHGSNISNCQLPDSSEARFWRTFNLLIFSRISYIHGQEGLSNETLSCTFVHNCFIHGEFSYLKSIQERLSRLLPVQLQYFGGFFFLIPRPDSLRCHLKSFYLVPFSVEVEG